MTLSQEEIATRFERARRAAGLKQGDVARVLGVSRPQVSNIEAGVRRIREDELPVLAKLFRVDEQYFFGGQ